MLSEVNVSRREWSLRAMPAGATLTRFTRPLAFLVGSIVPDVRTHRPAVAEVN
ncbi:hypothetical protein SAMN05444422_103271 [Halobiforma haloterrestris]|uniref:Uncharacterized protein n=1 Tax=Natronobacterium haloterrestre TaxID=148448 RepID=A0A1I1FB53_NATHA|nr:hypothetical protein SAMN05444422_103271 [Halobiforma haloterrestris]